MRLLVSYLEDDQAHPIPLHRIPLGAAQAFGRVGRAGSRRARRRLYRSSRGRGRGRLCLSESAPDSCCMRSWRRPGSTLGSIVIYVIGYKGGEELLRKRIPAAALRKDSCGVRQASLLEPDVAGDASAASALQDFRAGCGSIRDGIRSLPVARSSPAAWCASCCWDC